MNITCKIAMDLAELYKAGIVSKESAEEIRRHLRGCEACRKYYHDCDAASRHRFLVNGTPSASEVSCAEARGYAAISRKLRRRRMLQFAGLGMAISISAAVLAAGILMMNKGNAER